VAIYPHGKETATLLVTGGGAFNTFLVNELGKALAPLNITVVIPEPDVVKYKEALVMALIGALRWREESNVLSTVTGASRDSSGGAMWLG
jgi:anhydro-N-acetylmuramic acid kinase